MGAYLSKPVTEKCSIEEKGEVVSYGASAMQGWRTTQEDSHNCIPNFDKDSSLFAVYDGHGGGEVAEYCSLHLPDYIKSVDSYSLDNLSRALEDAFLGFDETLIREEVVAELKKLARRGTEKADDTDENELDHLHAEARMPLEDVLKKYNSAFTAQIACIKGQKTQSPFLRAKDKINSSSLSKTEDGEECDEAETNKIPAQPDLSNGDMKNEESVETADVKGEQCNPGTTPDTEPSSEPPAKPACSTSSSSSEDISSLPGCSTDQPGSSSTRARKYTAVTAESGEDESSSSDDETFQNIPYADSDTDEEEGKSGEDEEEEEDDEDEDEEEEEEEEDECEDNEEYLDLNNEPGSESGCTAVVAIVRRNELYVANAGDSRCVVCRNGNAIDMSVDHKPEEEVERKRIVNAGGAVTMDGRVNGGLNLSRAIGDHTYKKKTNLSLREQMITSLPDIQTLVLKPEEDEFMVLACDGIWNYMKSQEVVDFVKERLNTHSLSAICEEMFDLCLAPNTHGDGTGCDNMTAIIVRFHSSLGKWTSEIGNVASKRKLENGSALEQSDQKRAKSLEESLAD